MQVVIVLSRFGRRLGLDRAMFDAEPAVERISTIFLTASASTPSAKVTRIV
jgi:hypothetical protein